MVPSGAVRARAVHPDDLVGRRGRRGGPELGVDRVQGAAVGGDRRGHDEVRIGQGAHHASRAKVLRQPQDDNLVLLVADHVQLTAAQQQSVAVGQVGRGDDCPRDTGAGVDPIDLADRGVDHEQEPAILRGDDPVGVEACHLRPVAAQRELRRLTHGLSPNEGHLVQDRLLGVGEPGSVARDRHIVDEGRPGRARLLRVDLRAGSGVVDRDGSGRPAGDEDQAPRVLQAHGHLARRPGDEHGALAGAEVTPPDRAVRQRSGIDGAADPGRHALGLPAGGEVDDLR